MTERDDTKPRKTTEELLAFGRDAVAKRAQNAEGGRRTDVPLRSALDDSLTQRD